MPIPKPKKDEVKEEFISRCITTLRNEDPEKPQKQIAAICYDAWDGKSEEPAPLHPADEKKGKAIDITKCKVWEVVNNYIKRVQ
jgi:hypothetical protein